MLLAGTVIIVAAYLIMFASIVVRLIAIAVVIAVGISVYAQVLLKRQLFLRDRNSGK